MSAVVTCQACDRQYRWKEEYAGRKMKCRCGEVFVMPDEPTAGDNLYEMAEQEAKGAVGERVNRCPSCGGKMKPGAVLCIGCGYNTATGEAVVTAINAPAVGAAAEMERGSLTGNSEFVNAIGQKVVERANQREAMHADLLRRHRVKEWISPLVMLVVGVLALPLVVSTQISGVAELMFATGGIIVLQIFVMVPALLVSLFIAAWVLDTSFGSLWSGLLKLTAIAVGPGLLADFVFITVAPFFALSLLATVFVAFLTYLVILGIPLAWLFELNFGETQKLIWIIGIVRIGVAGLIYALFIA